MKLLVIALAVPSLFAQTGEHWVSTWSTSPQKPFSFARLARPRSGAATANRRPAPRGPAPITSFNNQTVRMIARTTIGGQRVRIELSNVFGTKPLVIGAAHIAVRDKGSDIVAATDRALMFSGQRTAWIPPGATEISDPVNLAVAPESDLAVSLYLPEMTATDTFHAVGLHTTYISKEGDTAGAPAIADPTTAQSYYFLTNIDVLAPANDAAIVAFGDSITDGATSTPDTNASWPSFLAARLAANGGGNIAVLNQGISGNQILRDGAGINALARFNRDALLQPGAKWVMILEGINDIGLNSGPNAPVSQAVGPEQLIAGLKQMIERAHEHGLKVIGCTLTPFEGAAYYSEGGEKVREAVNQWIRSAGAFDAVVDFDKVVRDPNNPEEILSSFNIRDHLHPNDKGYQAMANAIDLSIFGLSSATAAK